MGLIRAVGLPRSEDILEALGSRTSSLYAEALSVLQHEAKRYLVAQGSVSLAEWEGLSLCERDALVLAGHEVEVDRAVRIAVGRGPLGPHRVAGELHPRQHDDGVLTLATRRAAARIREAMRGRQI